MGRQNFIVADPRFRFIATSRKSLAEIDPEEFAEAKDNINSSWVESMRSSSPTRAMSSSTSFSGIAEHNSWTTVQLIGQIWQPSALNMFEQIANATKGKKIAMFLDYDGTLSPIVDDPDKAFMSHQMRDAVRDAAKYFPTAIVSGRSRDKVYNFVKLSELYYAGSHGMDIKGPSKSHKDIKKGNKDQVLFQPANEFLPMIDEVYKALSRKTRSIPGAKVESNKFCLSVHYRCIDEKMWGVLAEQVRSVLSEYPQLKLTQGRKVLEIRPIIKWDKGKALDFLLESLGFNDSDIFPIYIGDDRTDEDAFKVLRDRGQGIGVLVTQLPKETFASYSVQDPSEVMNFLRRLVEWQRFSAEA